MATAIARMGKYFRIHAQQMHHAQFVFREAMEYKTADFPDTVIGAIAGIENNGGPRYGMAEKYPFRVEFYEETKAKAATGKAESKEKASDT